MGGRCNTMLFQSEKRAPDLAAECPGCSCLHLGQHCGCTGVKYLAEYSRDLKIVASFTAYLAKLLQFCGGRGTGIESSVAQLQAA